MTAAAQLATVLGLRTWRVQVRWPDGRREVLVVEAGSQAEAEEHALDTWGASVVATAERT